MFRIRSSLYADPDPRFYLNADKVLGSGSGLYDAKIKANFFTFILPFFSLSFLSVCVDWYYQ